MYIYVYVCICVYMCVYMYICVYICIYVCMCVCMYSDFQTNRTSHAREITKAIHRSKFVRMDKFKMQTTISDNKRFIVNKTLLRRFNYSLHQSKCHYTFMQKLFRGS